MARSAQRTVFAKAGLIIAVGAIGLAGPQTPRSATPSQADSSVPAVVNRYCIGCHNNDANSTKRDWKVGEVGGVLEIIRPLDRDIARTRSVLALSRSPR